MKLDADSKAYANTVADAIKRRRLEADLSMNKLAEGSGLSQPMIGLVERGVHTPTIATLFRIARALGTTPATLLAEVEVAPAAPKVRRKPTKTVPSKPSQIKKRPKPL